MYAINTTPISLLSPYVEDPLASVSYVLEAADVGLVEPSVPEEAIVSNAGATTESHETATDTWQEHHQGTYNMRGCSQLHDINTTPIGLLSPYVEDPLASASYVLEAAEAGLVDPSVPEEATVSNVDAEHYSDGNSMLQQQAVDKEKFANAIKLGLTFSCACCHQLFFKENVVQLSTKKYSIDTVNNWFSPLLSLSGRNHICRSCHTNARKNVRPALCIANNLTLRDIPPEFMKLNEIGERLVSLTYPFMKVIHAPKCNRSKVKGPVITVPDFEESRTHYLAHTKTLASFSYKYAVNKNFNTPIFSSS